MLRQLFIITLLFSMISAHAASGDPVEARMSGEQIEVTIFQQYLAQAKDGDVTAQFVVARRLERGIGTPKDVKQAYIWYRQAADKGHPLAQFIIESKGASGQAKTSAKTAPKPAVTRAPAPKASAAPKPVKVAKKAPAASRKSFDTEQIIMSGKWSKAGKPIGFLPSTRASCLKANANQAICFSEKFKHTVGANELVYSVKSTLTGFDPSGSFRVNYLYNVLEINKNKSNTRSYAPRITAKAGWQEPGQSLKCRLSSGKSITCTDRKGRAVRFFR